MLSALPLLLFGFVVLPYSSVPHAITTCLFIVQTGHGNPFMSYIRLTLNALLLMLLTSDTEDASFLYLNAESQAERDEIHPNPSTVLTGSFGNVNI